MVWVKVRSAVVGMVARRVNSPSAFAAVKRVKAVASVAGKRYQASVMLSAELATIARPSGEADVGAAAGVAAGVVGGVAGVKRDSSLSAGDAATTRERRMRKGFMSRDGCAGIGKGWEEGRQTAPGGRALLE